MADNQELKEFDNCPFCGGNAYESQYEGSGLVACIECGVETEMEKWNIRAQSKQLTATQQKLDEANKKIVWWKAEECARGFEAGLLEEKLNIAKRALEFYSTQGGSIAQTILASISGKEE